MKDPRQPVMITMFRDQAEALVNAVHSSAALTGAEVEDLINRIEVGIASDTIGAASVEVSKITTNRSKIAAKGDTVIKATFVIPESIDAEDGIRDLVNRTIVAARVEPVRVDRAQ